MTFGLTTIFMQPCCGRLWGHRLSLLIVAAILAVLGLSTETSAQGTSLTVHPKSQFWIQGEATTHRFTCSVGTVDGHATLPPARDSLPTSAEEDQQTTVVVTVPVKAFDCGNKMMTRDLKETLKMEEHPEIRFELIHATVKSPIDTSNHWRRVEVLGALTIAGTKRLTRLSAAGRVLGENRFRVRGCHPIRMTYYHIDPPTKAFGLVKVKNRVEVQFDLLAYKSRANLTTPFDSLTIAEAPTCPPR